MATQKEIWEAWTPPETLEGNVKLLLEILQSKEVSDNDREFHPTTITSVRIWDTHRLNKMFKKMKELVHE